MPIVHPTPVRAEQALRTAKGELEHAGGEWGGHRVQAMKHIDAALHELEQAEQWARQHHDIKVRLATEAIHFVHEQRSTQAALTILSSSRKAVLDCRKHLH